MAQTVRAARIPATRPEHPAWCAHPFGRCDGRHHRSAEVAVPGDELAGIQVQMALRGWHERVFVELTISSVWVDRVAGAGVCVIPRDQIPRDQARAVFQHPDDPVYVTDPHAHDLTLDQADALHRALGDLLSTARATDPNEDPNDGAATGSEAERTDQIRRQRSPRPPPGRIT